MNKLSFKDFLNLKTKAQEVDLSLDTCHKEEVEVNKERINKLFDIAMNESVLAALINAYDSLYNTNIVDFNKLTISTTENTITFKNMDAMIVYMLNDIALGIDNII